MNIQTYSQQDIRWKGEPLGFSTGKYTLGSDGCLVTDLAMVLTYFGTPINPLELNSKLKNNSGFQGSLYRWGSLKRIFPDHVKDETYHRTDYYLKDRDIQAIYDALDAGKLVVLWIDYNPKTAVNDMHFVLAIGYNPADENDITIIDPIDGKIRSLKDKYLGWLIKDARRTIEAYVVYEPKEVVVPEESQTKQSTLGKIKDMIIDWNDCRGKRRAVAFYVDKYCEYREKFRDERRKTERLKKELETLKK